MNSYDVDTMQFKCLFLALPSFGIICHLIPSMFHDTLVLQQNLLNTFFVQQFFRMKDRRLLLASFYTKRTKSFQNTGMIHNFYSLTLLLQTDARRFNICRKGLNGIAISFGRKNHDPEQLIYHQKLCYSSFNPQINSVKQIPKQIKLYAIVIRHSGS